MCRHAYGAGVRGVCPGRAWDDLQRRGSPLPERLQVLLDEKGIVGHDRQLMPHDNIYPDSLNRLLE